MTSKQKNTDLNLLDRVYHVPDAGYLCGNRQGCMKGTRRDILLQLEHWLKDEQDKRVFWLNGLAGTGKSTIAQTFAEMSFADGKLGASFFCSRDFDNRSNLQSIFPTLAFQLTHQYPHFRQRLLPVLKANCDVGQESLALQLEKLLIDPLCTTQIPTLIIIDALNECQDEEPASALLSVLSRCVDKIPLVKFFITGRPEPRIRSGFRLELLRPHTDVFRLHDAKPDSVNSDNKLFLRVQLTDIIRNRSKCSFAEDWPSSQDIDALCKKAAGFFIYASMVVKFVGSQYHPPNERLHLITSLPQDTSHEGKSGIDPLYTQVLEHAFHDADQHFFTHLKSVVGAVVLIFCPLSVNALSDLLRNHGTPSRIYNTLCPLHSLLIPDNTEGQARIFHRSFPNFLTDPEWCKDKHFFVDPMVHHEEIFVSCLSLMKERLKRNICNLDDHAVLSEVEDISACRKDHIGDALEYACCFWTKHLLRIPRNGPHVEEVQKGIKKFFTTHLLYWIEVLALVGNLGVGVYAINDVEEWCTSVSSVQIFHQDVYSHLFRQVFHVNGQMIASAFFWKILMQSTTLLPIYIIVAFPYPLPYPGFTSTMVQSSHKELKQSGGSQLNGGLALAQLDWMKVQGPSHAGKTPLQLVYDHQTMLLFFLMQSQAARWLFFLGTQILSHPSYSHQMGCYLHLEVVTRL